MKVLVFTTLYPNNIWPNHGIFIKERMIHFAKLDGCEIRVVAPVPYFPPININWRWRFSQVLKTETRDGVEVYHPRYFMIPKVGMSLYGLLMFASVLPTIKKLQQRFNFDLIDAHFVYPDGLAAVLLGKYFGKPVVVSGRGSDINLYSSFKVIRRLLKYALNQADAVIVVSSALKHAVAELGVPKTKINVISNGVDFTKFYPIAKADARKRLGLPTKRILLSVGSLTANKGIDLLIKAFYDLNNLSPAVHYLVIIGDGVMRSEIEELISFLGLREHVRLIGTVSHEKLNLWYNAADLFCLLSESEGWPNVILESLACGTPVVATAVGGIPEIIGSETVGYLTNRERSEIIGAMRLSLEKSWRYEELANWVKPYSWDDVAQALQHLYKNILSGRNKSGSGNAPRGRPNNIRMLKP